MRLMECPMTSVATRVLSVCNASSMISIMVCMYSRWFVGMPAFSRTGTLRVVRVESTRPLRRCQRLLQFRFHSRRWSRGTASAFGDPEALTCFSSDLASLPNGLDNPFAASRGLSTGGGLPEEYLIEGLLRIDLRFDLAGGTAPGNRVSVAAGRFPKPP